MLKEFKGKILVPYSSIHEESERIITKDHLNFVKSNDTFDFEEIDYVIDINNIQDYLEYDIIGSPIIERTQDCNGGYLSSYYYLQICLEFNYHKKLTTIELWCGTDMDDKKHHEMTVRDLDYIKYDDLPNGFRFEAYKGYRLNLLI